MLQENQNVSCVALQVPLVVSEFDFLTCIDSVFKFLRVSRYEGTVFYGVELFLNAHPVKANQVNSMYDMCKFLDLGHPILAAGRKKLVVTGYLESSYSSPIFYILDPSEGSRELKWMELQDLIFTGKKEVWAVSRDQRAN